MRKVFKAFLIMQFALTLAAVIHTVVNAEKLTPGATIKVRPALLRTPEDMQSSEIALLATGEVIRVAKIPFRSTMNEVDYKAAKAAATTEVSRPEVSLVPLAPPIVKGGTNIEGVNQTEAGGRRPPDTHGAIGRNHFVEITNQHVDMYLRDGTRVRSVSLASFFGYTVQDLFDPRCVYDKIWNRWVIIAEAFEESATVQRQFIAVSKTEDPEGAFFIYNIDVNFKNNDDFWDYPQLGMDQDAIIITANVFGPATFREARMFAVAKARLYNGLGFNLKMFTGLVGTLAPPIVLDQNKKAFLVAAPNNGSSVTKYTLENSSRPNGISLNSSTITVPAYSIAPDASQPGTTEKLDTIDNRFQNASTQIGNSLWQVHTINVGGKARPKFYEFSTSTNTVIQSGNFFASSTSHDWNASIAANALKDVFVTWSSTLATATTNAQVRFSGRKSTDPPGTIPSGSALFTSSTFYNPSADNPERWGDYSAVTLDPRNSRNAWIVNEKINTTSVWGSRIGRIGF